MHVSPSNPAPMLQSAPITTSKPQGSEATQALEVANDKAHAAAGGTKAAERLLDVQA